MDPSSGYRRYTTDQISVAQIIRRFRDLETYVSQHAIAVDSPLREYYLLGPLESMDLAKWRTEIGWPVFQTRQGVLSPQARPQSQP